MASPRQSEFCPINLWHRPYTESNCKYYMYNVSTWHEHTYVTWQRQVHVANAPCMWKTGTGKGFRKKDNGTWTEIFQTDRASSIIEKEMNKELFTDVQSKKFTQGSDTREIATVGITETTRVEWADGVIYWFRAGLQEPSCSVKTTEWKLIMKAKLLMMTTMICT